VHHVVAVAAHQVKAERADQHTGDHHKDDHSQH
jgi:hypothetical protein